MYFIVKITVIINLQNMSVLFVKKASSMVDINFNLNGNVKIQAERVDFDSAVNIRFKSVDVSMSAYQQLKNAGIKVFHVGQNGPEGPSVIFYPDGKTTLSLWSH